MVDNVNRLRRSVLVDKMRGSDLRASAAGIVVSSLRAPINNAGEADVDFIFSCNYSQLPTINFGYELQSPVKSGYMPNFSASVEEWFTVERLPSSRLYTGAKIQVTSETASDISFILVATATGVAFSGPIERGV